MIMLYFHVYDDLMLHEWDDDYDYDYEIMFMTLFLISKQVSLD